jgi:hypothetical protein
MWRIAVVLLAVGCTQPAVRPEPPPPKPPEPVITASPEGWWIETAETMNQNDVGQALHFSPTGLVVVRRGKVERISVTIKGTAPRQWLAGVGEDRQITIQQQGEQLFANTGKDTATMRKATADEARALEEQLTKAPAPTPVETPETP